MFARHVCWEIYIPDMYAFGDRRFSACCCCSPYIYICCLLPSRPSPHGLAWASARIPAACPGLALPALMLHLDISVDGALIEQLERRGDLLMGIACRRMLMTGCCPCLRSARSCRERGLPRAIRFILSLGSSFSRLLIPRCAHDLPSISTLILLLNTDIFMRESALLPAEPF